MLHYSCYVLTRVEHDVKAARRSIAAVVLILLALAGVVALRRERATILLRTIAVGAGSPPSSVIAVDGRTARVFVLGGDDIVTMLDTRTGAVAGRIKVGPVAFALAIDERTRRVFVVNSHMHAGSSGTVSVLDARSGKLLHTITVGNVPYAVAVDERSGRVFILNAASSLNHIRGPVSVLDASDGRPVRTIYAGPNGGPLLSSFTLAVDSRRHRLVAITGGLINGQPGNVLSVLDSTTGRLIRAQTVTPGSMAMDEALGTVFIVIAGKVQALDTATGRVRFAVATGSDVGPPLVDARRGRLFLGTPTGMSIRDARTGALLHRVVLGHYPGSPLTVDEATGRVLVAVVGPIDTSYNPTQYGRVSIVNEGSGAVLRTVTVGAGPIAAAIDERTGHAFVLNSGGTIQLRAAWAWLPRWVRSWLPFLPSARPSTRAVPGSVSVIDARR